MPFNLFIYEQKKKKQDKSWMPKKCRVFTRGVDITPHIRVMGHQYHSFLRKSLANFKFKFQIKTCCGP